MEKLKLIFTITILAAFVYSCNNSAVQRMMEEPVEPERAVGFTNWSDDGAEYKFHLGTDAAVQVVRDLDEVWTNQDWEGVRAMLSDTAKFYWRNGNVLSVDEFMTQISSDSTGSATWKFNGAFSVDLDPTRGGEHVHADYYGMYTKDGKEDNFRVMNRYYVIDGKIVVWNSYSQEIIEPEPVEEAVEETEE